MKQDILYQIDKFRDFGREIVGNRIARAADGDDAVPFLIYRIPVSDAAPLSVKVSADERVEIVDVKNGDGGRPTSKELDYVKNLLFSPDERLNESLLPSGGFRIIRYRGIPGADMAVMLVAMDAIAR